MLPDNKYKIWIAKGDISDEPWSARLTAEDAIIFVHPGKSGAKIVGVSPQGTLIPKARASEIAHTLGAAIYRVAHEGRLKPRQSRE